MGLSKESVDVIIPTFNSQEFLFEAINSCYEQTYPINQVIIIDDGSAETFLSYLKEIINHFPDLKIIYNLHTGLPGVGRQSGINASDADWVAFLDSDDYWAPEKIRRQIEESKISGSKFVFSNGWKVGENLEPELFHEFLPKKLSFSELLKTNWLLNSSVIVKRELFCEGTSYATSSRVRAVEDYATWLRLATRCQPVGVDEPLTYYREHGASIRSEEVENPRIHAIADFIEWAHSRDEIGKRQVRKHVQWAIKSLKNQYLA